MGKKKRVQPQQNFQQLVAQQTLNKFKPYIDGMVQQAAQSIAQQQRQLLENLYLRVRVLEDIVIDKFEDITSESMSEKIADYEDKMAGLEKVDVVELGDRVRFSISTKTEDQDEFQGSSKSLLDNAGTGNTIGKELETPLIGMKAGETKEFNFGKDKKMVAKITVDRISRAPKKEEKADESTNEGQ